MSNPTSEEYEAGRAAHAAGQARMQPYPPPADAAPGSPESLAWMARGREWLRGWDVANAAAGTDGDPFAGFPG